MESLGLKYFLYWILMDTNSLLNSVYQFTLPRQWVTFQLLHTLTSTWYHPFHLAIFVGRAVISHGDFNLCLFTCVWLFGIFFGEVVFQAFWPFPTAFLIDL